jgi:hypothetical protein
MSLPDWFKAKQIEIEQIVADAEQLRARWGREAEHRCEEALSQSSDPTRRRILKQVRKALRHLPGGGVRA